MIKKKGEVGLIIDSKATSAGLLLSDTAERKRASVFIGDDGLVGLTLLNTQGNPLLLMGESKTGPLLTMSDSKGNARIGLGLFSVGPTLRLWDENGQSRSLDSIGHGNKIRRISCSLCMSEKSPAKRMIVKVDVARVFPATDPIAIDLLRLMCGCCDLFHVAKWIFGTMQRPKEFGGVVVAHGRTMLQFRLLASYLHESLSVLQHLVDCPEFDVLRSLLNQDSAHHLAELQNIKLKGEGFTSRDWGVSEVIRRARHTASFHYDIKETQEALNRWTTDGFKFGKEGYFVVELDKNQEKAWSYYAIADLVRAEISFGLTNEKFAKNNKDLMDLVGRLTAIAQSLFFAYVDHRNLHDFVSRRGP